MLVLHQIFITFFIHSLIAFIAVIINSHNEINYKMEY